VTRIDVQHGRPLLDLPLEVLTAVCQQLDLRDLVRVAETCKRFLHGDGWQETVELPTKSPVVTALREFAFPAGYLVPSTCPVGSSESWVAYLARCVRQRRCREAPPIAAGYQQSLFADRSGRLLVCGEGAAVGHGNGNAVAVPTPVVAMTSARVRSLVAQYQLSLALTWDGRVYSWGSNESGQLGLGDQRARSSPALVEGLEGVRSIVSGESYSLAVTHSVVVYVWGCALLPGEEKKPCPLRVEGFGGVRVRRVCAGASTAFAIGEDGELFSWGGGCQGLGHGDEQDQPSPKRVEALRGVPVSCVAIGGC
jgi:hypothetical protein